MSEKKTIIIITVTLFLLFLVINIISPIRIEGDGVFYYSWLRSTLFDHDFNFYNELSHFSSYDVGSRWMIETNFKTTIGKIPNPYAYGTGLMWLPFFAVANLFTLILKLPLDGYSLLYVWSINLASWIFGLIAWYLTYLNLRKFFVNQIALWTSLGAYLATPWFYYQYFEPSMSHLASLALVSIFLHLVINLYQRISVNLYVLSVIIFMLVATRWQNLLFLIILGPYIWESRHSLQLIIKRGLTILIPIVIFWLTQFAIWKYLYGHYFLQPQGRGFVRFDFHGLYILFSSNRGLLLWSPIIILAICGFYFLYKKSKLLFYISISAFIVQWLINGSLNDLGGGDAYGGRRFIETLPFLAFAIAAFWSQWKNKWLMRFATIVFVIWNLILIQNYRHNQIPHHGEFKLLKINYFESIINNK